MIAAADCSAQPKSARFRVQQAPSLPGDAARADMVRFLPDGDPDLFQARHACRGVPGAGLTTRRLPPLRCRRGSKPNVRAFARPHPAALSVER